MERITKWPVPASSPGFPHCDAFFLIFCTRSISAVNILDSLYYKAYFCKKKSKKIDLFQVPSARTRKISAGLPSLSLGAFFSCSPSDRDFTGAGAVPRKALASFLFKISPLLLAQSSPLPDTLARWGLSLSVCHQTQFRGIFPSSFPCCRSQVSPQRRKFEISAPDSRV